MSWKPVEGADSVLENDMKEFEVDGVAVLIARNATGYFAYPALCPHMEAQLAFGTCDGKLITCMQHLWQWDMETGDPVGMAEESIKTYPTKFEEGRVWIFFEEELKYAYMED
ncbi:MAG: Rieske 2Fe-2S domain-containing protein [Pseudomonadota bacterium]